MNDVHQELVLNWDQTGLQLMPTGEWNMHEAKSKTVPITHSNDKHPLWLFLKAGTSGTVQTIGPMKKLCYGTWKKLFFHSMRKKKKGIEAERIFSSACHF